MDLKEMWNNMSDADFSRDIELSVPPLGEFKAASQSPLQELRAALFKKIWVGILIILIMITVFIVLLISGPSLTAGWSNAWIFLAVVLGSLYPTVPIIRLYRRLPGLLEMEDNVYDLLVSYRNATRRVIYLENLYAKVSAIPAPALGAWYGMMSGMEKGESLTGIDALVILGIGILFAPLVIWLTKKLNKKAFGKSLERVEELIAEMEQV